MMSTFMRSLQSDFGALLNSGCASDVEVIVGSDLASAADKGSLAEEGGECSFSWLGG